MPRGKFAKIRVEIVAHPPLEKLFIADSFQFPPFLLISEKTTYFEKIFRFHLNMEPSGQVKNGAPSRTIGSGDRPILSAKEGSLTEAARAVEFAMAELLDSVRASALRSEQDFCGIRLLSREQAADLLDLSLSQLDRLTKKGSIPTVWIDRRPRYPLSQIREWIAARTSNPAIGAASSFTANKKMMKAFSKFPGGRGE